MANYTLQYFIAGYAQPNGRDVFHAHSLEQIKRGLQLEHRRAQRYGAAYEPSRALIWRGEMDDITDVYPDLEATMGPGGGVTIASA